MLKLIVNADDLGMSPAVNDAVFAAMDRGRVSSATILANGPALDSALERIHRYPQCSFGVHLNLSEFAPLTDTTALAPLLDERGHLSRKVFDRRRLGDVSGAAIYRELCAQVERLQGRNVKLTHADSHQHVHTTPALFPTLFRLQRRFRFAAMRLTRNVIEPPRRYSRSMRLKKALFNGALRRLLGVKTTEGFTDLRAFCAHARAHGNRFATFEAMVHPGASLEEDEFLAGDWPETLPFRFVLARYWDL